jgi:hypothetical protein
MPLHCALFMSFRTESESSPDRHREINASMGTPSFIPFRIVSRTWTTAIGDLIPMG